MVKRNKCPCCGNYTLVGDFEDITWDICPVCFWENDVFDNNPDSYSGANRMTLKQGRSNYKTFSACDESMIKNVRPPRKNELPENNE